MEKPIFVGIDLAIGPSITVEQEIGIRPDGSWVILCTRVIKEDRHE